MLHLTSCLLASAVAFSVSQAAPLRYHDDGLVGVSGYGEIDWIDVHRYPARYRERIYYAPHEDILEPEVFRYFPRSPDGGWPDWSESAVTHHDVKKTTGGGVWPDWPTSPAHVPESHVSEAHVPEAHVPEAPVPEAKAHVPEAPASQKIPIHHQILKWAGVKDPAAVTSSLTSNLHGYHQKFMSMLGRKTAPK